MARLERIRHWFKVLLDDDTLIGRVFDWFIQALIVLSLITFSIDTLPSLPPRWVRILDWFEWFVVGVFTIEYAMRVTVGGWRYVLSWWGLIDLLAIVPGLLGTEIDLRTVRILRLIRFVRVFKLTRYTKALHRLHVAFGLIWDELAMFFVMAMLVLYLAAVGIYYFEHDAQPEQFASIFHALWWAVATLTTVGYGDVYPVTAGGKFFTFIILMIGLGIVSVPTGLIASALQEAKRIVREEEERAGHRGMV